MNIIKIVVIIFWVFWAVGCTGSCQSGGAKGEKELSEAEYRAEKERLLNAATSEARQTVQTFIENLQNPQPHSMYFCVKMAFSDGLSTEPLWVAEVTYDGQYFHGVVATEPERVKNVAYADEATVLPQDILDWAFVEKKKLKGGYTIKAYQKLSSKNSQYKDYDQSLPFAVE